MFKDNYDVIHSAIWWCYSENYANYDYDFSRLLLYLADIYLLIMNNENRKTMCEFRSKLTIKTSDPHHWLRVSVSIINFEKNSNIILEFPLLTLNK